ncbi:phenylacetate--CoA ligase family protein [Shewanella glacialipiscicola]|uniref:Phenylacetate-coenzyme A ligase n=1 Tax=Shewanella glacialipiscicola TaxID=614069 RepID=A0ABQ6J5M7_9GAMM|nr:phenylacetate--CoA ligase family protein [Shewanella glacialipiscicola]MCL1087433.1 phenylacetate--CoA ligase family protein [Shewanella glacialipiscicola]MCU7995473.1 phenylacetate--CoA ligase family protein [Shewanella glacialipiscicola]MCU8026720.1 phenylacetate--CoA ligase family protein [Shewanella glacialipiscicola]GIU11766.1 phenylacetate-coenzyme A ligase [Shewanella glacialipiscicola]GMA82176.1 phenylacetate-coenzyme A ligase [Shewanella glacialipiscicola]
MSYPNYFQSFDINKMLEDYPLGDELLQRFEGMSKAELKKLQNERFLDVMEKAWTIPFYQRIWGDAGVKPQDIKSLDDITKLPLISKSDIMESVERFPPFGDFHGLDNIAPENRPPIVFHTTSGTTGTPQPLLFGPKSREIQSLLVGRSYRFMGLKPASTIQSCYGHGMINGGHYIREAVTHYTNSIFLSAGTGVETRSVQQVNLMKTFGVNVLVGFVDYIKRLSDVAKEEGIVPGKDIKIDMIIGHLGMEGRDAIAQAWGGAELFDWYGVGDTGTIAAEGPDHDGMHVWEDAHYLEILDTETNEVVAPGTVGNMVVTCLYKDDVYPIIRFNTHDITEELLTENKIGFPFKRIRGFMGRSDNMVKLRGINIYPQGVGPMLEERKEFLGEFICKAIRDENGRDEFIVYVEVDVKPEDRASLLPEYKTLLKQKIGIEVGIELVGEGELTALTQVDVRQKPIRLLDERVM